MSEVTERLAKQPKRDTLIDATRRSDDDAVGALISAGADVNAEDEWGCTPLLVAIVSNYARIAEMLIKAGAVPTGWWYWGWGGTMLERAGFEYGGADNSWRGSPMYTACSSGDAKVVDRLLHAGANRTSIFMGTHYEFPLVVAAYHPRVVRALLSAGAAVNANDDDGNTALHELCRMTLPARKTMSLLLAAGANINAVNNDGCTPLCMACGSARPWAIDELLRAGAEVNKATAGGNTPLHWACRRSCAWAVKKLLATGVLVDARDLQNRTAREVAIELGFDEGVHLIDTVAIDSRVTAVK
jgi:ankyrin repeat protein